MECGSWDLHWTSLPVAGIVRQISALRRTIGTTGSEHLLTGPPQLDRRSETAGAIAPFGAEL